MSSGGGGGLNINMPTYEGSLSDALEAQVNLLRGSGNFADIGSLQNLVEQYERPLRMSQAQIGTDVLRQTLLGGMVPIYESVAQDEMMPLPEGSAEDGTLIDYGGTVTNDGRVVIGDGELSEGQKKVQEYFRYTTSGAPQTNIQYVQTLDGGGQSMYQTNMNQNGDRPMTHNGEEFGLTLREYGEITAALLNMQDDFSDDRYNQYVDKYGLERLQGKPGVDQSVSALISAGILNQPANNQIGTNAVDILQSKALVPGKVYLKNEDGSDFYIPRIDADGNELNFGDEGYENAEPKLTATSDEELPTNVPGDGARRAVAGEITGYTRGGSGLVDLLGDTRDLIDYERKPATQADVDLGLADEVGDIITKEVAAGRKAGFDSTGAFKGLSVLAEDIQRGNLSRQREADLTDVERLAGRYSTLMEDFKPATTSGLQGARDLLEEQKEAMTTGGGAVTVPTGDTFGGNLANVNVADPLQLSANTEFGGELATDEDTLRSALLARANTALDQGLTAREKSNIEQAARARQTATGRIFDPKATITEAEDLIKGDQQRLMQNRAFAQSVLGQEAGLQQGDITRGMAQEAEQAGLQQRADLTQADIDARQAIINQGQRQQANQFGVGATMDAERLNEQLRQQGLANYVNAVGNLSQIERSSGLDPFQALLGRGGGTALSQGAGVLGAANYGLAGAQPSYLNPEAGLGFISQMAANQADMYAANVAADAARSSGFAQGLGGFGGGIGGGLLSLIK